MQPLPPTRRSTLSYLVCILFANVLIFVCSVCIHCDKLKYSTAVMLTEALVLIIILVIVDHCRGGLVPAFADMFAYWHIRLLLLQATIALRVIVPCGVSLSNAAHGSQSPQSNTRTPGRRSQGRLTKSVGITHASV